MMYTKKIVMVLFFIFSVCTRNMYADTIEPSKIIDVVRSSEKEFKILKWQCKTEHFRIQNEKVEKLPYSETSEVCFNLKNRTYHVKQQGKTLSQNAQGKVSIVPFTSELSFDGKIYREWRTDEQLDKTLSQETLGVVSMNLDDCILNKQFIENGYAGVGIVSGIPVFINLPPFLNINPCSFSDLLTSYNKNKRILSGEVKENNEISIIFSDEFELSGNKISLTFDILFDPVNSVIVNQHAYYTNTSPSKEYSTTTSEFLVDGRRKIPKKITFKQIYSKVILQTDYFFEKFEINPPTIHDEFQISFPDGIYVEDYVLKLFYKVGDIIDEDKAIGDFMQRHGLTGNVPRKLTSGGIVRYILIGAGCLLILIALILHIRKRRQSP